MIVPSLPRCRRASIGTARPSPPRRPGHRRRCRRRVAVTALLVRKRRRRRGDQQARAQHLHERRVRQTEVVADRLENLVRILDEEIVGRRSIACYLLLSSVDAADRLDNVYIAAAPAQVAVECLAMSSSLGLGVCSSSATDTMIIPGVQ